MPPSLRSIAKITVNSMTPTPSPLSPMPDQAPPTPPTDLIPATTATALFSCLSCYRTTMRNRLDDPLSDRLRPIRGCTDLAGGAQPSQTTERVFLPANEAFFWHWQQPDAHDGDPYKDGPIVVVWGSVSRAPIRLERVMGPQEGG